MARLARKIGAMVLALLLPAAALGAIGLIDNGDSGLSVRTKLNTAISELNALVPTAGVAHKWIASIDLTGLATLSQPSCGDLTDGTTSCSIDTTNATNIIAGTLQSGRLTGTYSGITGVGALSAGSLTAGFSPVQNSLLANSAVTISGHPLSLGGSLSLSTADVGLGNVTNDVQTKAAVVPNSLPLSAQLLVGNAGGTAYVPQSLGGDCTLSALAAITCTKTSGVAFAASATTDTTNAGNIVSGDIAAARMSTNFSAAMDTALGSTRGSVLYRGATGWTALTPGLSGKFLQTAGAGADPLWATVTATPGGIAGQIQFNSAGSLGGFTASGDATIDTSTGAVTVSKTSGVAFAASATTDTTNAGNISSGTLSNSRLTGVPNSSLATMANSTTKCRTTVGTGVPDDCTAAQLATILNSVGGVLKTKLLAFTRDLTLASGNVSYTGMGFQPTWCIIIGLGVDNGNYPTFGLSDSARTQANVFGSATAGQWTFSGSQILQSFTSASNAQVASMNSYDADGFTLAWIKAGTPAAGTGHYYALCGR